MMFECVFGFDIDKILVLTLSYFLNIFYWTMKYASMVINYT